MTKLDLTADVGADLLDSAEHSSQGLGSATFSVPAQLSKPNKVRKRSSLQGEISKTEQKCNSLCQYNLGLLLHRSEDLMRKLESY